MAVIRPRSAPVDALAARYLRVNLDALLTQLPGVRSREDPERVHQARVATRRARAALRLLEPRLPPGRAAAWQRTFRRLARRLGEARDLDVQAEAARRLARAPRSGPARAGVRRVLVRLRLKRDVLQPRVVAAVDRFLADGALGEASRAADRLAAVAVRPTPAGARRPVLLALEGLEALAPALRDPAAREEHHAMRIAAKRLRYVMESLRDAFGEGLEPFVKQTAGLQGLLGDLHDADVWLDDLPGLEEEERLATVAYLGHERPFARVRAGFAWLRRERRRRRGELLRAALGRWGELTKGTRWDALRRALGAPKTTARWRSP